MYLSLSVCPAKYRPLYREFKYRTKNIVLDMDFIDSTAYIRLSKGSTQYFVLTLMDRVW